MRRFLVLYLSVIMVLQIFLSGCDKETSPRPDTGSAGGPATNEIWMHHNQFNPSSITVPVNTTLKWVNKDQENHTVVSNGGVFESGTITPGGTFSYKFSTAGTYNYRCTLHANMTAIVIVQ